MYTTKTSISFDGDKSLENFRRRVYELLKKDNTSLEKRFESSCQLADRIKMIETIFEIPYVKDFKITPLCHNKNQTLANQLYEKSLGHVKENPLEACATLTEALFAANPDNQLFLDILSERAKVWYNLEAFANCIKDCDCMLSQAISTLKNENYLSQRKKECVALKRQCSKALKRKCDENFPILPSVDGKRNLKLPSCSDAVVLDYDKQKGRHLVATRYIEPGSVLIVDRAFSYATEEESLVKNCLHCHVTLRSRTSLKIPCNFCQTVSFCSEHCRAEAWQQYHKYECWIFDHFLKGNDQNIASNKCYLLLAYRTTVGALKTVKNNDFVRYHSNKDFDEITYDPLDYRTVLQLETHCSDSKFNVNLERTIDSIFFAKCLIYCLEKINDARQERWEILLASSILRNLQAISCNAYEIVENVKDEEKHVWEPRRIGGAIYTTVSLTNHSCYPNVVRHTYKSGWIVVRAVRSIKKGEEILDCYGPHFLSENFRKRQEGLENKYHFKCQCGACKNNWQLPLPEINYACMKCSNSNNVRRLNDEKLQRSYINCSKCGEEIYHQRIEKQLKQSIKKRIKAIEKMYAGYYKDALPLLIEHGKFLDKFFSDPNQEAVVTQQCIIQCLNSFSCVSE